MENKVLIDNALETFREHTGVKATLDRRNKDLDGQIKLDGNYPMFTVTIKKHLRPHHLDNLINLNKQYHPLIVIAEHIIPGVKDELRQAGINYLETSGNMYLKENNLLFWIDGQKNNPATEKPGRAFNKTGIRLVYQLLINPELITHTYREIAEITGVSFGNINIILNDLKQQGFMVPVNKENWNLANRQQLIEKWATAYKEKLLPTIFVGRFRFVNEKDQLHWQQLRLDTDKTLWGGEPAGALLTNYLKPEIFTLYTTQTRQELIQHYRLIPDNAGNVQVFQQFWKIPASQNNTVHPLLAYIDLINTGDRRCIETAQKIKDAYLQNQL